MVKERGMGTKFGAIRWINNYLRLKFRHVFCMWHRMWLMRKHSSFSLRAMRFHNSGRVHADCTPTGYIAKECGSVDLHATNCVKTVVGKASQTLKLYCLTVLWYVVVILLRIYLWSRMSTIEGEVVKHNWRVDGKKRQSKSERNF
jgi:hypothetical protein